MAVLAVQQADRDGLSPVYGAATGGGDEYANDLHTLLHVKNGGAGAVLVTIVQQQTDNQGFTHDIGVSIPAGEERMIAAHPGFYNNAQGRVAVSYDVVTSVTVAAIRRDPTTR